MTVIFLIGRIIFGGYFIKAGINHFKNLGHMAGFAASKGVPSPKLAVGFSGLLALIGGASIVLGLWPGVGILSLLVFMIPVTYMMHPYWKEKDPAMRMNDNISFYKNVAIIGALLMMVLISGPWPYSL
jgi:putative oxidoreductase